MKEAMAVENLVLCSVGLLLCWLGYSEFPRCNIHFITLSTRYILRKIIDSRAYSSPLHEILVPGRVFSLIHKSKMT